MVKRIALLIALAVTLINTPTQTNASTLYRVKAPEHYDILLVGDSRTVGTLQAVSDSNIAYVCEVGQGLTWLKNKALPDVKRLATPGTKVVFNLGVNDLRNYEEYTEFLNDLTLPKCELYFETVNPVDTDECVRNSDITKFNNYLEANLEGFNIIDTNSYITAVGYETADGLHYGRSTTLTIYDYLKEKLNEETTSSTARSSSSSNGVFHQRVRTNSEGIKSGKAYRHKRTDSNNTTTTTINRRHTS